MVETIQWTQAGVVMIDQTRLPLEEKYVTCRDYEEVATEDSARQSSHVVGHLGNRRPGVGSQGQERLLGGLVLGREGAPRFPVAVLLGDEGLFHRLARIGLHVMAIDVDRVPWRDVTERDQTCAQRSLEIQGAFDGNRLQEPVRGGR